MSLYLPFRVSRFLQTTSGVERPRTRFGRLQWVLSRPLYRFQVFELAQVPAKSRPQALRLEMAQWTPFERSGYFVGWSGARALVWGWNANKVQAALEAQGLKPRQVQVVPETLLQMPLETGLCLIGCSEGVDGQLWRGGVLARSRWWSHAPSAEEWLSFQRDAAIPPEEQQLEPPLVRQSALVSRPWLRQAEAAESFAALVERPAFALGLLSLSAAAFWFGSNLYKVNESTAKLREQQASLEKAAAPMVRARSEALDALARVNALRALGPYPDQLTLMNKIAEVLPNPALVLKDWDFSGRVLKITLTAGADVSATPIIDSLQRAEVFSNVQALPGRDTKAVTFQMDVVAR